MKIKLSTIIDTIFTAFISFILAFVFFYYFFERNLAITFSAVLSALITLFAFKKLTAKNEKYYLTKADTEAKNIMVTQLNIYTVTEQTDLIEKAIKKAGYSPERKRGFLYLKDKGAAIFSKFGFDGVSKTDIVKIFNSVKRADTAYILSEKFTPEIQEFADRFDGRIKTVSADKVYRFLADNDCLPQQKFLFKQKTPLKLSALKTIFEKKKAKYHLLFGIVFLAMSYFVPIKTYYIVVGAIFLILALFCRLFGMEEPTQSA